MRGSNQRVTAALLCAAMGVLAPSAGAASCPAEFTGDCALDFDDVLAFVEAFGAGAPSADLQPDGIFDWLDVFAYLVAFGNGCGFDADGDRLSDCAETNTGVYVSLDDTGTDPANPDTDGDKLRDGDEVLGTTAGLDLPALGVSPLRLDLLVETDWFAGEFEGEMRDFYPVDETVELITACFAAAPLANPDGSTGVTIHIDRGQGGAYGGGEQLPGSPDVILFDAEFNQYKAAHFDPRRKGYFHYCIFANRYGNINNDSSGFAEILGDDFVVTLSFYHHPSTAAAAFVHEIGHNLALRHGGFENRNYKPNYSSVMNYRYTFSGIDIDGDVFGDGVLDYSRGEYLSINENAIDESQGVIGVPADLNLNWIIDAAPYAQNINCEFTSAPCGSNGGGACADSICSTLVDHNDWGAVRWDGPQLSTDRLPGPVLAETVECDIWPGR